MGGSSGGMIGGMMAAAISIADEASDAWLGTDKKNEKAKQNAQEDNSIDTRTPEQIAADNEAADTAAGNANPETKKKAEGKSLPGALGRDE